MCYIMRIWNQKSLTGHAITAIMGMFGIKMMMPHALKLLVYIPNLSAMTITPNKRELLLGVPSQYYALLVNLRVCPQGGTLQGL